jgi:uncharacterized Rossmann fold enzyme
MSTLTSYEGKVRFDSYHNTEESVRNDNIRATFERGYVRFNELMDTAKGKTVSIVGAGPSLSRTYKDIVGDVIACNSAHDFLIGKGIVPKYALYWDANPIIAKMALKPHPDVTYLVASRCHPDLFKALAGHRVVVFHALGGEPVEQFLAAHNRMEPMVGGGSAGVTRGTHLAGAIGYKDMHLFGVDSSYEEGSTHVGGSVIDQKKMRLRVCGKWFVVAPWMALQVVDFKMLAPSLKTMGVSLTVHGTGMFPYTASFMEGVATPDIKIGPLEWLKRLVSGWIVFYLAIRGGNAYAELKS